MPEVITSDELYLRVSLSNPPSFQMLSNWTVHTGEQLLDATVNCIYNAPTKAWTFSGGLARRSNDPWHVVGGQTFFTLTNARIGGTLEASGVDGSRTLGELYVLGDAKFDFSSSYKMEVPVRVDVHDGRFYVEVALQLSQGALTAIARAVDPVGIFSSLFLSLSRSLSLSLSIPLSLLPFPLPCFSLSRSFSPLSLPMSLSRSFTYLTFAK